MPVSPALRRLLRVRNLEEEQQRLALDAALADLHALEHVLESARARERRGRQRTGTATNLADRVAALVETQSAARHAAALVLRIAAAQRQASDLRGQFLSKRVERRQAETLIREAEAADALAAGRHAQQDLDDWFGGRTARARSGYTPARPPAKKL
ncbi:MAG TPA: hypothetical protein VMD29_01835 [Terracidiphilus sp.]|nr:hypothetical protein [Terracidiphilus sp.]